MTASTNNDLLQLAQCYWVGFGCIRDPHKADLIARKTRHRVHGLDYDLVDYLDDHLEEIEEAVCNAKTGSLFSTLQDDEISSVGVSYAYYLQQNCLETAILAMKRELAALEEAFGPWNYLVLEHQSTLAVILTDHGDRDEAEKLRHTLMKKEDQQLGHDHLQHLVDTVQTVAPVSRYDAWLGDDELATEGSMSKLAFVICD